MYKISENNDPNKLSQEIGNFRRNFVNNYFYTKFSSN